MNASECTYIVLRYKFINLLNAPIGIHIDPQGFWPPVRLS